MQSGELEARPRAKETRIAKGIAKVKRSQKAILRANFDSVIARLSEGESLQTCLRDLGVDWKTFFRHIDKCPEARQEYSHARVCRVERYVDELVPMSDAVIGAEMNVVTATRNAVDVRKWVASRLMPREYGDQATGSVTINNQTNVMLVSDDKLRELQETRRKMLSQSSNNVGSVDNATT